MNVVLSTTIVPLAVLVYVAEVSDEVVIAASIVLVPLVVVSLVAVAIIPVLAVTLRKAYVAVVTLSGTIVVELSVVNVGSSTDEEVLTVTLV